MHGAVEPEGVLPIFTARPHPRARSCNIIQAMQFMHSSGQPSCVRLHNSKRFRLRNS